MAGHSIIDVANLARSYRRRPLKKTAHIPAVIVTRLDLPALSLILHLVFFRETSALLSTATIGKLLKFRSIMAVQTEGPSW